MASILFQLVSRGRIHVFKYLEIQAIKEDRKRGVLTDSEYRRSYRKTTQLNDFRYYFFSIFLFFLLTFRF